MNRKRVLNDNAEVEPLFHSFKAERFHKREFQTEKERRAMIIDCRGFYNQRRIHASLGYRTPVEYEVALA
ncbi:MAG: transposase [Gammaproteobacteria bacterium]|nr:transposase [Gammaproteobacteria bacterium]